MKEIHIEAGENISSAAKKLAANAPAFCIFNDIRVEAKGGESVDQLTASYFTAIDVRSAEYRNSDEGKQAAQERTDRIAKYNRILQAALVSLDTLDFSDIKKPMKFLNDIADATDYVGVDGQLRYDVAIKTVKVFGLNNLTPNMCLKNDGNFDYEDPIILAKYIIGQCLDGLNTMRVIPPMYLAWYARWMR